MRMSHNDGSELDANLPKMSNYAHTHLFTEYTPPIFEKPVPLSRIMGARGVIFDTAILSHSDNDDLKARAVPGGFTSVSRSRHSLRHSFPLVVFWEAPNCLRGMYKLYFSVIGILSVDHGSLIKECRRQPRRLLSSKATPPPTQY